MVAWVGHMAAGGQGAKLLGMQKLATGFTMQSWLDAGAGEHRWVTRRTGR